MWFATYLYRNGLVSADQVLEAAERQITDRAPIGRLALELKYMTMKQVCEVLAIQADTRRAFGQIAVEKGYLKDADLAYLLMVQGDRTRPIDDYLVELGAIDRHTLNEEFARARGEFFSESECPTVLGRTV